MSELLNLIEQFEGRTSLEITPSRGRILVIDDEPGVRQGLERTLGFKGYAVTTVSNGRDGINLLDNSVDVVILDVKLPRMDGTEVYRQLKAKRTDVPIIFFQPTLGVRSRPKNALRWGLMGLLRRVWQIKLSCSIAW